jgi:hypothetical protein
MRRLSLIPVIAALVFTTGGCGGGSESTLTPTATIPASTTPTSESASTDSDAPTTSLSTTTSASAPTASSTVDPTAQTIYRPQPVEEGDHVIAMIVPVEGVVLDGSSVSLEIVEFPDGRFLEMDLTNAVVPENAAFWTTEINGRPQGRSTARQGSTMGRRVDKEVYGDTLIVTFSAVTSDDLVLATTGEVRIVD